MAKTTIKKPLLQELEATLKLMAEYQVDEIMFPDGLIIKKSLQTRLETVIPREDVALTEDEELFGKGKEVTRG